MGFRRLVMPDADLDPSDGHGLAKGGSCELIGVRTIGEALDQLLAG